jgi:hypothetical protein
MKRPFSESLIKQQAVNGLIDDEKIIQVVIE